MSNITGEDQEAAGTFETNVNSDSESRPSKRPRLDESAATEWYPWHSKLVCTIIFEHCAKSI